MAAGALYPTEAFEVELCNTAGTWPGKKKQLVVLPVGCAIVAQRWYWRKNFPCTDKTVGGQHYWFCLHYLMQHGSCSQD